MRSFLSEEDHDLLKAAFKERRVKVAPVEVTVLDTEPEPDSVTDTDTQDRRCLQCGMVLVGLRSKFCSDECRWMHQNHLRTERAEQSRQKIRVVCGVEFRASPDYSRSRVSLMNKGNVILSGRSQCAAFSGL